MNVQVDIVLEQLIASELGPGKRIGSRVFWPCPFHEDGTPSLTLMPDGNRFICFGCGKMGDAIDWVCERQRVSFLSAVEILNGRVDAPLSPPPNHLDRPKPIVSVKRPDDQWMLKATAVVGECAEGIWAPSGRAAITELEGRGINRDTVARWKLGYNHRDRAISDLFVRQGILIPWLEAGSVRAIKIRRPMLEPKYVCVTGSCPAGLFLAEAIVPGRPTLVVEGEFDALLGWQEIKDVVNVVTLGSATDRPDPLALKQLISSPSILLCYDNDAAGDRGTNLWSGLSARTRRVAVPHGKDITDFVIEGGDLHSWITELLHQYGWENSIGTKISKESVAC